MNNDLSSFNKVLTRQIKLCCILKVFSLDQLILCSYKFLFDILQY